MAAVSETIVREYFEMNGFFVLQQRKYIAPTRREEEEVDFLVMNPLARPLVEVLPFELTSADLARVARAVVVVKGWHTETFSSAVLVHASSIFRFFEPSVSQQAAKVFGGDAMPTKILVVPALPQGSKARAESIELLRAKGIDAVIPFRTVLADLINGIEANRNYQKSDLLQVIRVLKSYDLLREPQMEFFKEAKRRRPVRAAQEAGPVTTELMETGTAEAGTAEIKRPPEREAGSGVSQAVGTAHGIVESLPPG